MPKGVEHVAGVVAFGLGFLVFSSLMPKGVEHSVNDVLRKLGENVFSSLMPKGVEHSAIHSGLTSHPCVFISDAERR